MTLGEETAGLRLGSVWLGIPLKGDIPKPTKPNLT